ncbi:type 4a pilus biogenesis protein PilO [bacterium]|nr:type 4a pilus biogenesis protein PilO [candidate division CSSED10-310 bacterium]
MAVFKQIWNSRSTREKRIIILGLLVAVIYVVINFVFDPVYAKFNQNKRDLQTNQTLLKRYERMLQNAEKTHQKLQEITSMQSGIQNILLTGATSDLANAELQGIVKNLAQRENITFTQIKPQKTTEVNGYTEISLSIPFTGNIQQIQAFLYELDSAERLISIKSMEIKRNRRRNQEDLRIDMDVAAYIRSTVSHEDKDAKNTKGKEN